MSDNARNEVFYQIGKIEGICLTSQVTSEVVGLFGHILESTRIIQDALLGKRDPYFTEEAVGDKPTEARRSFDWPEGVRKR
jgi:hypothetical protein